MVATPDANLPRDGGLLGDIVLGLELLTRSAGALVGASTVAGIVALVASGAVVGLGIATRRVRGPVLAATVAGLAAALVTIVSVVQTRGGIIEDLGWSWSSAPPHRRPGECWGSAPLPGRPPCSSSTSPRSTPTATSR
jgi:hypothetical protein